MSCDETKAAQIKKGSNLIIPGANNDFANVTRKLINCCPKIMHPERTVYNISTDIFQVQKYLLRNVRLALECLDVICMAQLGFKVHFFVPN